MGLYEIGLAAVLCGLICSYVSETLWRGGAKLTSSIIVVAYLVWLVFMVVVASG